MAIPNPNLISKPKATGAAVGAIAGIPNPAGSSYPVKPPIAAPQPSGVGSAQAWVNNPASGMGGLDTYTKKQNDRFQTASAANDTDMIGKLQADSQRVGYTLNPYNAVPNPAPTNALAAPNTTAPSAYTDWQAKQNELMQKYETLMSGSFEYNPETDPKYQAFKTLSASRADAAAKTATRSTEEELNARGILNSSVTASQLGQIQQNAKQTAETEALAQLPQYEAQARQGYQDKLRNAADLLSFSAGRGDAAYQQEYTQQRDAKNDANTDRNYNRNVLEGDRAFNAQEKQNNFTNNLNTEQFNLQKAQQDWSNTFAKEQYSDQKAAQLWEQTFKDKSFKQSVSDAAASRGLQWASLGQRDKEFIAEQTFKNKSFAADQTQRGIDNKNKSRELDIAAGKAVKPKMTDYKLNPEFAKDVAYLKANPSSITMLDTNSKDFIDDYGYDGYLALRKAAGLDD